MTTSTESWLDSQQLRAVYRVSKLVRASLDLDTTLAAIAEAARQLTGAELTAILLLNDRDELEFRVGRAAIASQVGGRMPADTGVVGRALRARRSVLVPDLLAEPGRARPDLDAASGARAYIVAPLVWRGEALGVVTVAATAPAALTRADAALVEELAEQAAAAVAHARAYAQEQARRAESEELNRKLADQAAQIERAQRQLVQNEKLTAIGQLAYGIAHELNTPLGVIVSNLAVLQQYGAALGEMAATSQAAVQRLRAGAAPTTVADALESAAREADLAYVLEDLPQLTGESSTSAHRIAAIVRSVAMFARQTSADFCAVDIEQALELAITLAWNELKHRSSLVRSFNPVPPVQGQLSELIQVFVHLLLNAAQAVDRQGVITVSTAAVAGEVIVSIADTGCGIAAELLPRIFDPFFSTRGPGQGTGMGLPVCHGIVTRHGGSMDVESATGKGTTVTVRLPATEGQTSEAR